jgi:hypothetical protein
MLRRESTGLKFYSLWTASLSKLNPDLTKSLELFVEISVVTWRSLIHCARRALARDLAILIWILITYQSILILDYIKSPPK